MGHGLDCFVQHGFLGASLLGGSDQNALFDRIKALPRCVSAARSTKRNEMKTKSVSKGGVVPVVLPHIGQTAFSINTWAGREAARVPDQMRGAAVAATEVAVAVIEIAGRSRGLFLFEILGMPCGASLAAGPAACIGIFRACRHGQRIKLHQSASCLQAGSCSKGV